jgi:hypothetical protein
MLIWPRRVKVVCVAVAEVALGADLIDHVHAVAAAGVAVLRESVAGGHLCKLRIAEEGWMVSISMEHAFNFQRPKRVYLDVF